MELDFAIFKLNKMIKESESIVFFGGAGVSTESGIPDFRSSDGIYMMDYKYPPEKVVSHTFFLEHPKEFYDFYREFLCYPDVKPNISHFRLAELEKSGKLSAVITQNIDSLHEDAGSKNVIKLHGDVKNNYCVNCGKEYDFDFVYKSEGVPKCSCGGTVRPRVTLFEEPLESEPFRAAEKAIAAADMLIVAGTSMSVYPAAGLVGRFKGRNLVLINKDYCENERRFSLVIHEPLGRVMNGITIE